MSNSRLKAFHSATIAVTNLEQAAKDWEQFFGATIVERREDPVRRVRRAQINMSDFAFELAEPIDKESPLAAALNERGEGLYSVAVLVNDVAAVAGAVQQAGGKLVGEPGAGGPVYVHPDFTRGVLIELRDDRLDYTAPVIWKKMHHVAVATRDMMAAAADYERLFGGASTTTPAAEDAPLRSMHYHLDERWFGLAQPFSPEHPMAGFLKQRGERVYLIGAETGDREAAAAAVKARGGALLGTGEPGTPVYVHPKCTHGLLIELYP